VAQKPCNYFAPGSDAKYCDQLRVGLSVCLSAGISKKQTVQISPNFLYILRILSPWLDPPLPAMQYVMYFQFCGRMTSCFHLIKRIGQNQRRRVCFVQFTRWPHRERSMSYSPTSSCWQM